jgi:hypothetical protein
VRNGPGLEIRDNPSSLFVKNRADSPLLMRANILSDLTNVSERLAQIIQFISLTIFFYARWHQMIVMKIHVTVEIYYCGGYDPEENILSELTDVSEILAQTNQFIS